LINNKNTNIACLNSASLLKKAFDAVADAILILKVIIIKYHRADDTFIMRQV